MQNPAVKIDLDWGPFGFDRGPRTTSLLGHSAQLTLFLPDKRTSFLFAVFEAVGFDHTVGESSNNTIDASLISLKMYTEAPHNLEHAMLVCLEPICVSALAKTPAVCAIHLYNNQPFLLSQIVDEDVSSCRMLSFCMHPAANMFFIPYGIKLGSGVTVRNYIAKSMIPVLIGNIISGAFFVAGSYAFCYGTSLNLVMTSSMSPIQLHRICCTISLEFICSALSPPVRFRSLPLHWQCCNSLNVFHQSGKACEVHPIACMLTFKTSRLPYLRREKPSTRLRGCKASVFLQAPSLRESAIFWAEWEVKRLCKLPTMILLMVTTCHKAIKTQHWGFQEITSKSSKRWWRSNTICIAGQHMCCTETCYACFKLSVFCS